MKTVKNPQAVILMKYIIVGGSAFMAEYGTFVVLLHFMRLPVLLANTFSFMAGLLVSFTAQRYWTFAHNEKQYAKQLKHQLLLYILLAGFNLLLSTTSIWLFIQGGAVPLLAKLISVIIIAVWNYFVLRGKIFTIET